MTKVLSFSQSLWHWLANHVISPIRHTFFTDLAATMILQLKRLPNRLTHVVDRRQGLGVWLIALTGAILLMVWNGVLLLSLSIGLGTVLLIQRVKPDPKVYWQTVSKWLSQSHATTLLSMGCGLLSLVASYLTLSIWQDTGSFGLALAILLQGLALLTVVGLFLGQMLKQDKQRLAPTQIDYWINNLTALDPLKRLIAVRQISHFAASTPFDVDRIPELKEYLQLLLQQESEPSIQNAIVEGLAAINTL